jgi:hypothetical protein
MKIVPNYKIVAPIISLFGFACGVLVGKFIL